LFPCVLEVGLANATGWAYSLRCTSLFWGDYMIQFCRHIWSDEEGQDIAEYAVMLAVILVLVIGTVRLIGTNANKAFSSVASEMQ
jgi:Flp pilus assembly pilin Flp